MELVKTETQRARLFRSKSTVYGTGWKHAELGEEPTFNLEKSYDDLRNEYVLGYIHGQSNKQALQDV
jgi:hypothetical protein